MITNTNALIVLEAAKKLSITTKIVSVKPIKILCKKGKKTHLILEKSFKLNRSKKAKNISRDKYLTLKTLGKAGLPVPRQTVVHSPSEYLSASRWIPFPQAIKPQTGEKAKLVYLNISNYKSGYRAIKQVLAEYPAVVVEAYQQGKDYRFLVLNGKVIGLTERLPPQITGDGRSNIKQLIEAENQRRFQLFQQTGRRLLNRMRHWPRITHYLHLQGFSLKTVLPQGKRVTLYPIPNFSCGGSTKAIDPKTIPPYLIKLAETAAKTVGLTLCGVDMIVKNNRGVIIEVNSDPGLRLHDWPNQGQSQHVAEKILRYIFYPSPKR